MNQYEVPGYLKDTKCGHCGKKHIPSCLLNASVNGEAPKEIFVNWYCNDRPSEDGEVSAYSSNEKAEAAVTNPHGKRDEEGTRVVYVRKEPHDFFPHYRLGVDREKILAYVVRYSDGTYLRNLNDEGTGYVRAVAHRWLPCELQAAEMVAKAFRATVERIYAKARAK